MTRDEAVKKLNWALDNNTIEDVQSAYEYIMAIRMAIEALEQEPKRGHWIWEIDETPSTPISPYELNYAGWVCSCCHEFPDDVCEWDNPDEPPIYKFCPNCGSDNREVEE